MTKLIHILTCGLAGSSSPNPQQSESRSSTLRSSEDHRRGVPFPHLFNRHHSDKHEETETPSIINGNLAINVTDTDFIRGRTSLQLSRLHTATSDGDDGQCVQTLNLPTQIDGNLGPVFA